MRLLFYSHDGLGLGHVRRNLAIASAVTQLDAKASVLLVSSTDHIDSLVVPPRVDILKLPGLRKVDRSSYASRRLAMSPGDTWSLRSSLIAAATRSFAPGVLLADKHPIGAHGELREALAVHRAAGGRTALGLRDILDDPATVRREWADGRVLEAVARHHERVLVYGRREVLDVAAAYALPPAVARLVRYCGYVVSTPSDEERRPLAVSDGRPVVLATAGGGEDGYRVLSAFAAASAGAPWHPVVVSGSDASPADRAALQREVLAVGGTYHRFLRDLPAYLPQVGALVCMGGYNSLGEALAAGTPTVVVPRVEPRTEQLIRARAFAALGLVRTVSPGPALAEQLRPQVAAALRDSRERITAQVHRHLDLDGARRAAALLLALASDDAGDSLIRLPDAPTHGPRSSATPALTEHADVAV